MIELKLLILLLVAYHTIKIYYDSKRNYPPLDYASHSTANTQKWRWRKPSQELKLQLVDDEKSSHLFLGGDALGIEKLFMALGYLIIGFVLLTFIKRSLGDTPLIGVDFIIIFLFLLLGYGALNVGKYVSRMDFFSNALQTTQ